MDVIDLYATLDRKFKKALPKEKYEKVITKLDKMIGLIYGSIVGLLCGAATQPLGPKSAAQAYGRSDEQPDRLPFCKVNTREAMIDPILGQLMSHISELKISKWDPAKYKMLTNYKSVIWNSSILRVDLNAQFVEQIRMNKNPYLYNLFSEDFYTRVPICALFGEPSVDVTIGKIMQTHTSFEASAYGILVTSILRIALLNDDLFSNYIDWNDTIKTSLLPLLEKYYKIYQVTCIQEDAKSEASKLRSETFKTKLDESYQEIINKLNHLSQMYTVPNNEPEVNIDHATESHLGSAYHLDYEEKEDYKITSIYQKELDELKLENKNSSHPALLAIWTVKTLQAIHKKLDITKIEPVNVSRLILQSVAIKTGCSAYNCMIVGSILGNVFGFTQIPEEFYDGLNPQFVHKINQDILEIIACM